MTDDSKSDRRAFLKGQSALDLLRQKVEEAQELLELQPESLDRQTGYLEQYAKNAMACEFELSFNLHQYKQSGAAAMAAFELIDRLEDQMTVYRDHSELSRLNQNAFARDAKVEQELFGLLKTSKQIFVETGGAFDITSAGLSKLWGFENRSGALPTQEAVEEALKSVGSEKFLLDEENLKCRFSDEDVKLNLGGIGKGFALDKVAELFVSKGVNDFLIHGGQSSVLAFGASFQGDVKTGGTLDSGEGDHESEELPTGWEIGVTHPTVPGKRLGTIELVNQAIGTSGTARQGFYHQGKRYGHIIDPRTGWPTSHFLSTTVVSSSAALSDALATAFYVMNLDDVESFCHKHQDVGAIIVVSNEKIKGNVEVVTFNLDERWRAADAKSD